MTEAFPIEMALNTRMKILQPECMRCLFYSIACVTNDKRTGQKPQSKIEKEAQT